MKITERRLRSIIKSVIKESHYSDDLSGGHMGPDPVQALGPGSRPDNSEKNNLLYGKNGYKEQIKICYEDIVSMDQLPEAQKNINMIRNNFRRELDNHGGCVEQIIKIETDAFKAFMEKIAR